MKSWAESTPFSAGEGSSRCSESAALCEQATESFSRGVCRMGPGCSGEIMPESGTVWTNQQARSFYPKLSQFGLYPSIGFIYDR